MFTKKLSNQSEEFTELYPALYRLFGANSIDDHVKRLALIKLVKTKLVHTEPNKNVVIESRLDREAPLLYRLIDLGHETKAARNCVYYFEKYNQFYQQFYNIFRLLLVYGADPTRVGKDGTCIAYAKKWGLHDIVELIVIAHYKPRKSLVTLNNSSISFDENTQEIKTTLEFKSPELTIKTSTKKLEKTSLHHESIKKIFLNSNNFQSTGSTSLETIFEKEFTPKETSEDEKYLDTYHANDKNNTLIGFQLFELRREEDHVIFHGIHIFIDPKYRRLGIMDFIALRPVCSLVFSEFSQKTGYLTIDIDSSSYLFIANLKNIDHFPKKKPPHVVGIVANQMKAIYGPNVKYDSDETMYAAVEENIRIPDKKEAPSPTLGNQRKTRNIHRDFFDEEILQNRKGVGAPVYSTIGDQFITSAHNNMSQMGINFIGEALKYSKYFQGQNRLYTLSKTVSDHLPNQHLLFWNNKLKIKNKDKLLAVGSIRSKL